MANNERTILMHEDPSKETWDKSVMSKIKKRLKERASARNFRLEYRTDKLGTWSIGLGGIKVKKEF